MLLLSFYVNNLVKVPDVINLSYSDACSVLSSVDLRYNYEINPDNLYVTDQYPSEGAIVHKQTEVTLVTSQLNKDAGRIQAVAEDAQQKGIPLVEINIHYMKIQVLWKSMQDNEEIMRFGTLITDLEVTDLYLEDTSHNVIYTDYMKNDDGTFSFFNIPAGGYNYKLHSEFIGYDMLETTFAADSVIIDEEKITLNVYITPYDNETLLPYVVHMVDSDGNPIQNSQYSISLEDEWHWYGNGYTNEYGCAGAFYTYPGQIIYINLEDTDIFPHFCIVEMTGIEEGEFLNYPVVIFNDDGSYQITYEQDFFNH